MRITGFDGLPEAQSEPRHAQETRGLLCPSGPRFSRGLGLLHLEHCEPRSRRNSRAPSGPSAHNLQGASDFAGPIGAPQKSPWFRHRRGAARRCIASVSRTQQVEHWGDGRRCGPHRSDGPGVLRPIRIHRTSHQSEDVLAHADHRAIGLTSSQNTPERVHFNENHYIYTRKGAIWNFLNL
jgi:hypothetical protein